MKRVYTDERFPELEIINDGSPVFTVMYKGQKAETFESWERGSQTISEPFARQRAQDWFGRLEKMHADAFDTSEKEWLGRGELPEEPHPVPSPGVTSQQIDDLMAQEKLEQDPEKKQALRQQIMQMMRREESLAAAVVNQLIR